MVYKVIGLMSGSSLDGLDIAFVEFQEQGGKWSYDILKAECYPYSHLWRSKLDNSPFLSLENYLLLDTAYGQYLGEQVNSFIEEHGLVFQVALISSHGHTTFHLPGQRMTAQIGDGAALAAETGLPVVSDLRSLDVALGGQGAPIVPIGEKLLLNEYDFFLNLGGIANISVNTDQYIAFDVCPANQVLNAMANKLGSEYDKGGQIAAGANMVEDLLQELNELPYYKEPYPKSLSNEFGTITVYARFYENGCSLMDGLRTYTEHIAIQLKNAISMLLDLPGVKGNSPKNLEGTGLNKRRMLVTGGGAFNTFLMQRIEEHLKDLDIEVVVPDDELVKFKEAMIMAFIGVLRWRQEYNVLSSVTGATRNSIGGALWNGQEA